MGKPWQGARPHYLTGIRTAAQKRAVWDRAPLRRWVPKAPGLPGALGHARQLAAVRHLTEADTAQAELAVHRVRTAAALAPGVGPDAELRLALGLRDEGLLRHWLTPP